MPIHPYKQNFEKMLAAFGEDDSWLDPSESGELDNETVVDMFFCIQESATNEESIVGRLFREAKLDPKNPFHWLDLMDGIGSVFYYEKQKAGAPLKWSPEFRETLGARFDQEAGNNPYATDEEVAASLRRKFKEYTQEPKTITRIIGQLRKSGIVKSLPNRNTRSQK
ncbi:hypothetical protein [Tardiphaga sp.]|jgi:hypothetical protein|uniref:hypothetical protein n=1 Tax=Tardiphaga sp. TaxID=1926292 RepID=UPI0037DA5AB9